MYINVHTSAHPSGEIRGQVEVPLPEGPSFSGGVILTGNYPAHGLASLTLSENHDLMFQLIAVNTSGAITSAHFHLAPEGMPGPVIFPICAPCSSYESGTWMNVSMYRAALASGGVYINVHTALNMNGEIRGQVMLMLPPMPTPAPVPSADGCPAPPMETCCTRIFSNASRTLRATLPGPVALASVTVWNDDGPGGPPAYVDDAQLARISLSIGSAGVMTGCALARKMDSYMGTPAPGGMMMPGMMPGYEGWDALCAARGSVVTLSMPAILDGPRPPGRVAVKICVRPDGDGMKAASLWIQGSD